MFVYRPHVYALDRVTTPDLVIDSVRMQGGRWLGAPSTAVEFGLAGFKIAPAWVACGAHYGTLLAVGFVCRIDGCDAPLPCGLARNAWRLAEVAAHGAALELAIEGIGRDGATTRTWRLGFALDGVSPARGEAVFATDTALALPAEGLDHFTIRLHDPVLGRVLTHRVRHQRSIGE